MNLREGFKRICILWSCLTVTLFLWLAFSYSESKGYLKSFDYYNQNAPQYSYDGNPHMNIDYNAYTNLEKRVSEEVRRGYLHEQEAREILDEAVANRKYGRAVIQYKRRVKVPLGQRINWDGIKVFFGIAVAVNFGPWALYWAAVYVGRGFKKENAVI